MTKARPKKTRKTTYKEKAVRIADEKTDSAGQVDAAMDVVVDEPPRADAEPERRGVSPTQPVAYIEGKATTPHEDDVFSAAPAIIDDKGKQRAIVVSDEGAEGGAATSTTVALPDETPAIRAEQITPARPSCAGSSVSTF